ncbi:sensor histidine kinase [Halovenus rubra]|uniref:Sensor histidine kinase n=2 Tax=Halovenus rubra TaxID=869890 RepID=A0ACC7DVU5_9EURY|nr:ATP-binding protein [Halovenus rubra]
MAGKVGVFGTPTRQGYLGLALVVGTGVATTLFALSHVLSTSFNASEAPYVFTPILVSVALVGTGIRLWIRELNGTSMLRIGGGVFLGMTVFGLLITWTITHEIIRGGSITYAPFVTVNSMSIGAFVGLILGWLNARNRRYEAKLERERNKLKQQTEELDEFAGIVSHDLRNPLNVATLQIENIKQSADSDTRDSIGEVETSLARMEQIIDDVLTMAREGQAIEEVERVSLVDVADSAWGNVKTDGASIAIADAVYLQADRAALEHILENLFRNAVEHGPTEPNAQARQKEAAVETRESSQLTVRVGTLANGFYVEDDGAGLPDAVHAHLFESGVTTQTQGTGFGLSIVKKLVTAHGWTVRATDSADGGARFEIDDVNVSEGVRQSWLVEQ